MSHNFNAMRLLAARVPRQIKGIVYIASHDMESLWGDDGIKYHTLKVSPAVQPHKTLASQIGQTVTFLRAHQPALVCSSCPKMRCCVVAAMMHLDDPAGSPIEACLRKLEACHALTEDLGASELEVLEEVAKATEAAQSLGTPRGPRAKSPAGPISPCAIGKRPAEPAAMPAAEEAESPSKQMKKMSFRPWQEETTPLAMPLSRQARASLEETA